MSHTTKMKVEHKFNKAMESVIKSACRKMNLEFQGWGRHRLYSSTEEGYAVSLPGWRYPVILNSEGIAKDDYNGSWGDSKELEKFLRRINAEKVYEEAEIMGYNIEEELTQDEIVLTLSGGDL